MRLVFGTVTHLISQLHNISIGLKIRDICLNNDGEAVKSIKHRKALAENAE
jgi:hypothetical protein